MSAARFDGPDYDHARDSARLTAQLTLIVEFMRDGQWRSLQAISEYTLAPQASISAQLRHLRKPRFGGNTVDKKYIGAGLYLYRLVMRGAQQ